MHENTEPTTPAAFTVTGAVGYSGLARTYLYENRHRVDWIKAGRRSLITRESLDRLLLELLQRTRGGARSIHPEPLAAGLKVANHGGQKQTVDGSKSKHLHQTQKLDDEEL